jgi:NTP pyrophosphatase (non-canonical NTP hydrolase)
MLTVSKRVYDLANRIAEALFNSNGKTADRLVFQLPDKSDFGGWSQPVVERFVRDILIEELDHAPPTIEQDILDFCESKWGEKDRQRIGLKLAEECGEVAGALIKIPEGRAFESDLDDEIGDCLIVLSQLAAKRGTTLAVLRAKRFHKIKTR